MEDGQFKVEKDVPPPTKAVRGPRAKYPFTEMKVGDSFAFPTDAKALVAAAAYGWGKTHGVVFSLRSDGKGTTRVWRMK